MNNEKRRGIFWAILLGIALAVLGGKSAPRIYADNQRLERLNRDSLHNITRQEEGISNRPWVAKLRLLATKGEYHLILSQPEGAEQYVTDRYGVRRLRVSPLSGNGPQAGDIPQNCTLRIYLPKNEIRKFAVKSVYKDPIQHVALTDWYHIIRQGEKSEDLTVTPNVKVVVVEKWEIVRS